MDYDGGIMQYYWRRRTHNSMAYINNVANIEAGMYYRFTKSASLESVDIVGGI